MLEENFEKNGGEYTEFQVGELFAVKSNPQLNKSAFSFSESGAYPYFTRTVSNNGILGYVDYLDDEHKIKGNAIAVGMLGMQFFYMATDFYAGQFTKTIYPKFEGFNEEVALYFISLFNKQSTYLSGRLVREFENEFTKIRIKLPTLNGELALGYMADRIRELEADRIRELEADRIRELEAYLQVAGLSSYTLTDEEKELIRGGAGNPTVYCNVRVGDLFTKLNLKPKIKISKRDDVSTVCAGEFDLPLVNAKHGSNGIMFYGRSSEWESAENTIDIIQNGAIATGDVYPQPHKCGVLWDAYLIKPISSNVNENILLYLSTCLHKSIKPKFSYDNKAVWQKVRKNEICLPLNDQGEVDYDYMNKYIGAVKKQVIKNLVLWKDKEIECMKKVVKA